MPTINLTIANQTVSITQSGERGPTGATGATGATGSISGAPDGTAGAPGIAFAADTDTGLFRPGANILAGATGGTERWRASASGFTIADAGSGAFFTNAAGGNFNIGLLAGTGSALAYILQRANADLILGTNATERMRMLAGGNTGFGTSTPSSLVHLFAGSGANLNFTVEANGWGGLKHRFGSSYAGDTGGVSNNALMASATTGTLDNTGQAGSALLLRPSGIFEFVYASAGVGVRTFAVTLSLDSGGNIVPGVDNVQNFGSAPKRWANGYFGTLYTTSGGVSVSDERYKVLREGGDLSEAEYLAWSNVRTIVYQDKEAVDKKGDAARLHIGHSWQDIKAAFEAQGLDPARYGLWCEDPVLAPVAKTRMVPRQALDADGNPLTKAVPVLEDGEPVFVLVQETEAVEEPFKEIQIVDGVPVLVAGTRAVDQLVFDSIQVKDAETGDLLFYTPDPVEGAEAVEPVPLMAMVPRMVSRPKTEMAPVMEDFEEEFTEMEPTGETRGALRYQECAVIEAAWLRRELALLTARVAALDGL